MRADHGRWSSSSRASSSRSAKTRLKGTLKMTSSGVRLRRATRQRPRASPRWRRATRDSSAGSSVTRASQGRDQERRRPRRRERRWTSRASASGARTSRGGETRCARATTEDARIDARGDVRRDDRDATTVVRGRGFDSRALRIITTTRRARAVTSAGTFHAGTRRVRRPSARRRVVRASPNSFHPAVHPRAERPARSSRHAHHHRPIRLFPSARARPMGCTTTSAARSTAATASSSPPPPCSPCACARSPSRTRTARAPPVVPLPRHRRGRIPPEDRHRQRGRRLLPRRVARLQGVLLRRPRQLAPHFHDVIRGRRPHHRLRRRPLRLRPPRVFRALPLREAPRPRRSSRGRPDVSHHVLGLTLDGRPLDCLRFGRPGAWTPEVQFAGNSPEDAAAVEAIRSKLSPWERDGGAKRVVLDHRPATPRRIHGCGGMEAASRAFSIARIPWRRRCCVRDGVRGAEHEPRRRRQRPSPNARARRNLNREWGGARWRWRRPRRGFHGARASRCRHGSGGSDAGRARRRRRRRWASSAGGGRPVGTIDAPRSTRCSV